MIPFMWHSEKSKTIEKEIKLVVASREGGLMSKRHNIQKTPWSVQNVLYRKCGSD